MKGWVIIVIVVILVAVGIFFILKAKKKKQDEADRKVLDGMNRDEFYAAFIPKWKQKWVDGSTAYGMDNLEWVRETAWIHCKELFKDCEETWDGDDDKNCVYNRNKYDGYTSTLPAKITNCAEPKIREGFNEAFYRDKPNPMNIDWAKAFWLPLELNKMGIEIHAAGVKEILNGIGNNIKR